VRGTAGAVPAFLLKIWVQVSSARFRREYQMNELLLWFGRAAGFAGVLICAVAAAARLSGQYFLGGFQVTTLLQVGMAAMIAGCLCLLVVLTESSK
jgi:hypothetical protein